MGSTSHFLSFIYIGMFEKEITGDLSNSPGAGFVRRKITYKIFGIPFFWYYQSFQKKIFNDYHYH